MTDIQTFEGLRHLPSGMTELFMIFDDRNSGRLYSTGMIVIYSGTLAYDFAIEFRNTYMAGGGDRMRVGRRR